MKRVIFPTRITRPGFLLRSVIALALDLLASHFMYLLPLSLTVEGWVRLIYGISSTLIVVWLFTAVIPRCRDMGFSAWASCMLFVPIANIVFFLMLFTKKGAAIAPKEEPINQPPQPTRYARG